jgi:UV DNA damage endonuclease
MFPLYDKVDPSFYDNPKIIKRLERVGQIALQNKMRITTHPGQFVVLSSDKAQTVKLAIQDINLHAWLFDKMRLPETPYYSINVHGGKSDRREKLISGINALQPSAKARLTLENCEFAYSVRDLLPVAEATSVPICFDSHHHSINPGGLKGAEALQKAMETWPAGIKPNTHLSNSKHKGATSKTQLRQHSDLLYEVPEWQKMAHNESRIDIDVEAKMKNVAIFSAVKMLGLELAPTICAGPSKESIVCSCA